MKNKRLLVAGLMLYGLHLGFAFAAPKSVPVSVGTAKMLSDGTLQLHTRPGWYNACAEESLTVKPSDQGYAEIKAEIGDIKPGETRPVPPEHYELHSATNPHAPGLDVSLQTDHQTYRLDDTANLTVLFKNVTRGTPLYIFDEAGLYESDTIFFRITDATGKTLREGELSSDPMPPPPTCHSFMRLMPAHIYGITFSKRIRSMGISQPGTYRIVAGYRAPFRADSEFSFGLPFWGQEMGDIPAAQVEIAVTK